MPLCPVLETSPMIMFSSHLIHHSVDADPRTQRIKLEV